MSKGFWGIHKEKYIVGARKIQLRKNTRK